MFLISTASTQAKIGRPIGKRQPFELLLAGTYKYESVLEAPFVAAIAFPYHSQ